MSMSLCQEREPTRGYNGPRMLSPQEKRIIAQLRAKTLSNEALLLDCEFTHSEDDFSCAGIIHGSNGYWVKHVSIGGIIIASNANDSLCIWKLSISALMTYGQYPQGFDLDQRTPLLEGPAARLYLIDQLVF